MSFKGNFKAGAGTEISGQELSSAVTLSDMEIFVFPRLLYSLVLSNIMSPLIWEWRKDPFFRGMEKKSPRSRVMRLKQYIMDHYKFNLDLETWGLTSKSGELERFRKFIDPEKLKSSNALFGYEGDKYYFDIDIRTHFGLDSYDEDIIPYWKTETVEAMDAFRYRQGYSTGAGECVSLSTLYAAALFIVARIPLEDIYLTATPLHSQNYVDTGNGLLTNNRRIVTRNMWFNGTPISMKARRALENEKVTIISHRSGYIHTLYPEATISSERYLRFREKLGRFLRTKLDPAVFTGFLRSDPELHKCLQVICEIQGKKHYIGLERLFEYESRKPFTLSDSTRQRLIEEVDPEEFHHSPMPGRITLNSIEELLETRKIDLSNEKDASLLKSKLETDCINTDKFISSLKSFCLTVPRLPSPEKKFIPGAAPELNVSMSREEVIEEIRKLRGENSTAELAFYAFRDLEKTSPLPFLKAAFRRNPVSYFCLKGKKSGDIFDTLDEMENSSIYPGETRLAQPDEVWNFGRGDGIEKALLAASVLQRQGEDKVTLTIDSDKTLLESGKIRKSFKTLKKLSKQKWQAGTEIEVL